MKSQLESFDNYIGVNSDNKQPSLLFKHKVDRKSLDESIDLFKKHNIFQAHVQEADKILSKYPGGELLEEALSGLVSFQQPTITALQCCWGNILKDIGIQPLQIIGHGFGEFAAAYFSSIITLEKAIQLAVMTKDGRFQNMDTRTLYKGNDASLQRLESRAAVSPLIPYWSITTSRLLCPNLVPNDHWKTVLEGTNEDIVRQSDLPQGICLEHCIEIGGGIPSHCRSKPSFRWEGYTKNAWKKFLELIREIYLGGSVSSFKYLEGVSTRKTRLNLPGYPFQKKRHWLDSAQPFKSIETSSKKISDERASTNKTPIQFFYTEEWEESTSEGQIMASTLPWLVFLPSDIYKRELQSKLSKEVICITPAEMDFSIAANFESTLKKFPSVTGILHMISLGKRTTLRDAVDATLIAKFEIMAARSLLYLLQGVAKTGISITSKIVVVTETTTGASEDAPNLIGSSLWGIVQTLRRELPASKFLLLDVPLTRQVDCIVAEALSVSKEDKVAFISPQRRLVKRLKPLCIKESFLRFEPNETYLITGAFGGLGLDLLQWMLENEARQLALIGRTRPNATVISKLESLSRKYSAKFYMSWDFDLIQLDSVRQLFADIIDRGFPEVKGVFHLAGTLDDGIFLNQTSEKFERVYSSKAFTAWNLHLVTREMNLKWFVLFSSVTSILGYPGQSNYGGANAFLDSLALARHRANLPALSINWGVWKGIGMGSKTGADENYGYGLKALEPVEGWKALQTLLGNPDHPVQVAVTPFVWEEYARLHGKSEPWLSKVFKIEDLTFPVKKEPQPTKTYNVCTNVKEGVRNAVAEVLGLSKEEELDDQEGFRTLGLNSMMTLDLINRITVDFEIKESIPATAPFDYPNINALSAFVENLIQSAMHQAFDEVLHPANNDQLDLEAEPSKCYSEELIPCLQNEKVAIIGMSCRFPGSASSIEGYWDVLRRGETTVTSVPATRWSLDEYFDEDPNAVGKMNTEYGSFLKNVTDFDAKFFYISPREMETLDPQQIILLEQCWEALERAGIAPSKLVDTLTGVFVGITSNDTAVLHSKNGLRGLDTYFESGTSFSTASGRISHFFGFQGPCLSIDVACASSLAAVHLAVQSLRFRESNTALAGGVNLMLSPHKTVVLCKNNMLSRDGQCKSFDERADGYVRGEGAGIVVLKRLDDARRDGDNILGVILGTALTHSGPSSGLTVPNFSAQVKVIEQALKNAGLSSSDVDYVEAHATGTSLGDPIECKALHNAFFLEKDRNNNQLLTIGTSKVNIGHLEAASGAAGLIKVLLSFKHDFIPPHRNFVCINPRIQFPELFEISLTGKSWSQNQSRRRVAGVSSFGFSGTNVHVVLEDFKSRHESKENIKSDSNAGSYLVAVSAKTPKSLDSLLKAYTYYFETEAGATLETISYTANVCRSHFRNRAAIVAKNKKEVLETLRNGSQLNGISNTRSLPRIAFLFTGQGSIYAGMGAELYATNATFRNTVQACDAIFQNEISYSLLETFFTPNPKQANLKDPAIAQPSLFVLQVALARMWNSLGIEPTTLLGHSIGEIASAVVAGIFTLEDGMHLICARGKAMRHLPVGEGGMLAVASGDSNMIKGLASSENIDMDIAAMNSPKQVVVSGKTTELSKLSQVLKAKGIGHTPLDVSHAFHSKLLKPIVGYIKKASSKITHAPPNCKFISTMTGDFLNDLRPEYWCEHALAPVRFQQAIQILEKTDTTICLELGPRPILLNLAKQTAVREDIKWLPSMVPKTEEKTLLNSLGELYCAGLDVKFESLYLSSLPLRLDNLPTYQFERLSFAQSPSALPMQKRRVSFLPILEADPSSLASHPLLGMCITTTTSEIIYENTLCLREQSYLADHVVLGHVVFPMSGYLELMLAIGKLELLKPGPISDSKNIVLRDVKASSPFMLEGDKTYVLQVILKNNAERNSEPTWSVTVHTQASDRNSWIHHASGELMVQDTGAFASPLDLESIKRQCTLLKTETYYDIFSNLEIAYGSTFQCVKNLWRGDKEGLSELVLSPSTNQESFLVHPIILDNTFQTLVMASILFHGDQDCPYIPIAVGEANFFSPVRPGQLFAYVTWNDVGGSDEFITGNCSLVDEHGDIYLQTNNFTLKRTTRKGLSGMLQVKYDSEDWFYAETWIRAGTTSVDSSDSAISNGEVGRVFEELNSALETDPKMQNLLVYEASFILFQSLALKYCEQLIWDMELVQEIRDGANTDALIKTGGVKLEQKYLFVRILQALELNGIVKVTSDDFRWQLVNYPLPSRALILNEINQLVMQIKGKYPKNIISLGLLVRCGQELVRVLRGEVEPLELIFPVNADERGSISATQLYKKSPDLKLIRKAISKVAQSMKLDQVDCLRILEIGAGTGSLTQSILQTLSERDIDFNYTFTDVSNFFLHKAKEKFTKYGTAIEYRILNIEQSPQSQGFLGGSWDMVIAGNVLHATPNMNLTINNVRHLLKKNGILLIGEAIKPSLFLDLVFGICPGWWCFKGNDERRECQPLLTGPEWVDLLKETGFEDCHYLDLSQSLLIAQARGGGPSNLKSQKPTTLAPWIIVGSHVELLSVLESRLKEGGENVVNFSITDINESVGFKSTIFSLKAVRGVIFLGNWKGSLAESTDAARDEVKHSHALLALLQVFLKRDTRIETKFMVVTFSSQVIGHERLENPFGATLWGMLRSIRREYPDFLCVNLDLSLQASAKESTEQILSEVYTSGNEVQVGIREKSRHVLRLETIKLEDEILSLPRHSKEICLVPGSDNLVESIRIQPKPKIILEKGEMEVEVIATGINFRDFLMTMGLYPKGHLSSFGTDFSGRILRVGDEVKIFRAGDEVFGFGEDIFGNVAKTLPDWVTLKPAHLSFETAAGMPSVFVTAYYSLVTLAGLRPRERVLIHAAAGGVGLAAIQIAHHMGAEVYVTASSKAKWTYLKSIGITNIHQSRNIQFGAALAGQMDVVLNSITGEGFIEASIQACAPGARFVELSRRGIWSPEEISELRPDITYHVIELDRMLAKSSSEVKDLLNDLMQLFTSKKLEAIPTHVFQFRQAKKAFGFMKHGKQLGKLVLSLENYENSSIRFRKTGIYLITGGLGGLGLSLAAWMIEHGAKKIQLTSRSSPTLKKIHRIQTLRELGCEVDVILADIGNPSEVSKLMSQFPHNGAPLLGIFHCAGVLSDGTLLTLNKSKFEEVYCSKVYGSWYLHLESQRHVLEHFVLFSSLASLLGPPGQSNHAAANAFIDSLGHFRSRNGLPATVINWGAWAEVGAAAEREVAENYGYGVKSFKPNQGWNCLEKILQSDIVQVSVSPFNWTEYFEQVGKKEAWLSLIAASTVEEPEERKLMQRRLSSFEAIGEATDQQQRYFRRRSQIQQNIAQQVSRITGLHMESIDEGEGFMDMGMDSIMALELRNLIQSKIGDDYKIPATIAYDHPNIDTLSSYLASLILKGSQPSTPRTPKSTDGEHFQFWSDEASHGIAVVGMACRFGSANTIEEFWEILSKGTDCVSVVPKSRFDVDANYDPDPDAPGKTYSKYGSFISDVDMFEPAFFGIPPKEAVLMDPQQRILLELAWESLERAGIPPDSLAGTKTGVFIGICTSDYSDLIETYHAYVPTSTSHSVASGRISFVYGFQGPSISIDTACSSSLVALHLAIQSLQCGDSDVALVGGVNLILTPKYHINLAKAGMLSKDGRCKTFDESADGFVRGEGCGMIVLKRISDATQDKDSVLAVIRGTAVNQDGASSSLTAPSGGAQSALIREALKVSGLQPNDISFIEAHGTGTELGDPIEQNALASIFMPDRTVSTPLILGSVKTNVGHCEGAAGICGVIKLVLSLQHKQIPIHCNFKKPNPMLVGVDSGIFKFPLTTQDWNVEEGGIRRGGVSSFGFSGTNAHAILEEYVSTHPGQNELECNDYFIFPISAKTADRLSEVIDRLLGWIDMHSGSSLKSLSYTLQMGRNHFKYRTAFVSNEWEDLVDQCNMYQEACKESPPFVVDHPKVGFVFTAVGLNVGSLCRSLYESDPEFKKLLREIDMQLISITSTSVIQLLFHPTPAVRDPVEEAGIKFVTQYVLAKFWIKVGIVPKFLFGTASSEFVAAAIGGFITLEDGFKLALAYTGISSELELETTTLSVSSNDFESVSKHATHLKLKVSSVYQNRILVCGQRDRLIELGEELAKVKIYAVIDDDKKAPALANIPSKTGEQLMKKFREVAESISYKSGKYLFFSASEGKVIDELTADYWIRTLGKTLDFNNNLKTLEKAGCNIFIQIGTTDCFSTTKAISLKGNDLGTAPILRLKPFKNRHEFLTSLGKLYSFGLTPTWKYVEAGEGVFKVLLPTYPFHKKSYWINEPRKGMLRLLRRQSTLLFLTGHPLLGKLRATTKDQHIYEQDLTGVEISKLITNLFKNNVISWCHLLELMVSACRESQLQLTLLNVSFKVPLVVATESDSLDATRLQTLKYSGGKIEIWSSSRGYPVNWNLNAISESRTNVQTESPKPFDIENLCESMEVVNTEKQFESIIMMWREGNSILLQHPNVNVPPENSFDIPALELAIEILEAVLGYSAATYFAKSLHKCSILNMSSAVAYTHLTWDFTHKTSIVVQLYTLEDDGEVVMHIENLKLDRELEEEIFEQESENPQLAHSDLSNDVHGDEKSKLIPSNTEDSPRGPSPTNSEEPPHFYANPLITIRSTGTQRPLFFFPNAYGLGYCYLPLAEHISPEVPLYALNNPELHNPRNSFKSISDYARAMVTLIRGIQPNGPYRFCGHCFGGLLAFFTSSLIQEIGEEMESLTLLDTIHPKLYHQCVIAYNTALTNYIMTATLENFLSSFASSVFFEARNSEFLTSMSVPPKYSGHVTFVKARLPLQPLADTPESCKNTLKKQMKIFHDAPLMGWEASLDSVSVYSVDAEHFGMLDEDNGNLEIAKLLNEILKNGKIYSPEYSLNYQILLAARNNDTFLVDKLLSVLKLDPNYSDRESNWSPLHWSLKHGNLEMAEILIRAGAKKTSKNNEGKTPLELFNQELPNFLKL